MADDVLGWCEEAQAFGGPVTVKVKFAGTSARSPKPSFSSCSATCSCAKRASRSFASYAHGQGHRCLAVTVSFDEPLSGVAT